MLAGRIDTAIADIRTQSPTATCPAHSALAGGIVLLLEKAKLELIPNVEPADGRTTIRWGNFTVSGGASGIAVLGVMYLVAKLHGWIP
jgi:hypothetical protein